MTGSYMMTTLVFNELIICMFLTYKSIDWFLYDDNFAVSLINKN